MATSSIGQLDPSFTRLVASLMTIERQPLVRATQTRDSVNVVRGAYVDLKAKLDELQGLAKSLLTTDPFTALTPGRSAAVSNVSAGYTVLTASASSSAIAGAYTLSSISALAREHRIRSDQQTYADQALNLAGALLIGGAAARAQTTQATIADTVTGFDVGAIASGQKEIGTGTYYVETRNDATNGWQFRLVDADGKAISIKKASDSTYTSNWQAIATGGGAYDAGLGLTLTFGADSGLYQAASKGAGAARVAYTAQGASLTVTAADSLNDIASAINSAAYAEGNAVVATVVDRQLVLAAKDTGTAHAVVASDSSGAVLQSLGVLTGAGAFKNVMQTALDVTFDVNGLTVTRSRNTGLDDVIGGVTLNLAPDAEGKSATLTVSADTSGIRQTIDNFIGKFNSLQTYLQDKTAVNITKTGDATTYTRGTLSGDTIFSDLRTDLFSLFMSDALPVGSGAFKSLRDLGLTVNDSLQATVADSAKLDAALTNNLSGVGQLFDEVMGDIYTKLGQFTGTGATSTGFMTTAVSNFDAEIAEADAAIRDLNVRLAEREQTLIEQYGALQAQLIAATYAQQQWATIFNSYGRF
jgi:flagellar hook-associated protein 2